MTYDKAYSNAENVFGINHEIILKKYVHKIDKIKPVLDIGIGQAKNSFFLASKVFFIDVIDISQVAVEKVISTSKKQNYNLHAFKKSFNNFDCNNSPYSAIMVFGLIQILDWKSIFSSVDKIDKWYKIGSLIFITAFSIKILHILDIARNGIK